MSFDRVAPHYRWMERWCAGELLQRCRIAHLDALVPHPSHVLIYGEGNGRFLAELCQRFPKAEVTVVDASATMLQLARQHLRDAGLSDATARVQFVHADAMAWTAPAGTFDLIVTHFFLDCLSANQLRQLIPVIARAAKPQAQWLLADFRIAHEQGFFWHWRSRLVLALLYGFFRRAARVSAHTLTAPDELLQAEGFSLHQRLMFDRGLLHSDCWCRHQGIAGGSSMA